MAAYNDMIAFRATPTDRRKLQALAEQTNRKMSDVLRLLVRQAVVADQPDIRLADGKSDGQEETTR